MEPTTQSYDQDKEHLRLLELFHKVVAGLYALFGFCGFPHFIIGLLAAFDPKFFPNSAKSQGPDVLFSVMFIGAGLAVILGGWTCSVLNLLASRAIKERRGITLIYITSGLNCMWMPFGTALGVFTFIVISRNSVRTLFPPAKATSSSS